MGAAKLYTSMCKYILYKIPLETWLPMTFTYKERQIDCITARTKQFGVTFIFNVNGEELVFCCFRGHSTLQRLYLTQFPDRVNYSGEPLYSHLRVNTYPFRERQSFFPN